MKTTALSLLLICFLYNPSAEAQDLPYHEIPEYPSDYGSGNVVSRLLDGLGFRYYWATDGLREDDLSYRPSEDGRTSLETLEHIHGLSATIKNAALNQVNERSGDEPSLDFVALRKETLLNIETASKALRGKTEAEIAALTIQFKRGDRTSEFPYWHMLNGPIADALYHTGQIVSYRRSSGNPMNGNVSVFMGKIRE